MENKLVEEWINIEEYGIPEGEFIVTTFAQDCEGVKIILKDERYVIKIFFDGIPVLLRNTVEGIRMRTWGEAQLKYHNPYFFRKKFFFEIEHSQLIKWCVEESCGFYEGSELKHYCIVTSEEMIDIVSTFKPLVEIIEAADEWDDEDDE